MSYANKIPPRSPTWNETGQKKTEKNFTHFEENILKEIKSYKNQDEIEFSDCKEKIELSVKKKILKYGERISENWANYLNFLIKDEVQSKIIENKNKIEQIVESSSKDLYKSLQEFEKHLQKPEVPELNLSKTLKEAADLKFSQVQYQSTLNLEGSLEQSIKAQIHSKISQLKSEISGGVSLSFSALFSSMLSEMLKQTDPPSTSPFQVSNPTEPIPLKDNLHNPVQKSKSKVPQVSAGALLQGFLL